VQGKGINFYCFSNSSAVAEWTASMSWKFHSHGTSVGPFAPAQRGKKSHPTKSRSHPRISKSPWHNAVNKLDQTCSYGSEILSCLCVLSNIWSKTVVFFDQPAVGTTDWTIKHLGVPELSFGAKFQWVGYTSLGHLEATWIFLLNPMDCI
jgi:hypothetical protein